LAIAQEFYPGPVLGDKSLPVKNVWWSLLDWVIGFLGSLIVAIAISLPLIFIFSEDILDPPIGVILIGGIIQQGLQFITPFVFQKISFGPIRDWKFRFSIYDPLIGVGLGIGILITAGLVGALVESLVNLPEGSESSNTAILTDAQGSGWIFLAIFLAVIAAPVCEELMFRGFTLRIFEGIASKYVPKAGAAAIAIVLSTFIFSLLHAADSGGWKAYLILQSVIFTVGCLLGLLAVVFDRLGPGIFAHMFFNGFAVVGILFEDQITEFFEDSSLGKTYDSFTSLLTFAII